MRRKVFQDFANVFCQRFIDLPSGYDLAAFARHGSGIYLADILSGESSLDGKPIPRLRTCDDYKEWLFVQLDKRGIPHEAIRLAFLRIHVVVDKVRIRSSYGHQSADAQVSFDCQSEINTDEKSYAGRMGGIKNGDSTGTTSSYMETSPLVRTPARVSAARRRRFFRE